MRGAVEAVGLATLGGIELGSWCLMSRSKVVVW